MYKLRHYGTAGAAKTLDRPLLLVPPRMVTAEV
jgi:hypothetical protein